MVERKSTGNSLGGKKKSTVAAASPKKTRANNHSMQFTSINSLKSEVAPKQDPKKDNSKQLSQQLSETQAVNAELNNQLSALNVKAALLEEV